MAAHESIGNSDEWYTPPWLFQKMGIQFDLDPCSPGIHSVPWIPTRSRFTEYGLERPWHGKIWLNPPYGGRNGIVPWLQKLCRTVHAQRGSGIALVPNRTATDWFQDYAAKADLQLFIRGKIKFLRPDGTEGGSPGYGNVLLAYGKGIADQLAASDVRGLRCTQ